MVQKNLTISIRFNLRTVIVFLPKSPRFTPAAFPFLKGVAPMPRKPRKPCKVPGCPNLTDGIYCEVHSKIKKDQSSYYERYQRDPEHSKRYGSAWQKVRARYAASHPYCELCYSRGIMTKFTDGKDDYGRSQEIHHIIPLVDGGTNDEKNLMSLCRSCHAKVHGDRRDRATTARW